MEPSANVRDLFARILALPIPDKLRLAADLWTERRETAERILEMVETERTLERLRGRKP